MSTPAEKLRQKLGLGGPVSDQPVKGTGTGGGTGGGTIGSTSTQLPAPSVPSAPTPSGPSSPVATGNNPAGGTGAGSFGNLPDGSTTAAGNYGVDNPNTANATQLETSQDAGLYTVGANLLTNYQNGTLPPGMMDYINTQQQEQIDELTQQFNNMGIGTDTTEYQSAVDQIKNNTAGVVATQLNQEYANGMQAFGMDSGMLQYVEAMNTANVAASAQNNATQAQLIGGIFGSILGMVP